VSPPSGRHNRCRPVRTTQPVSPPSGRHNLCLPRPDDTTGNPALDKKSGPVSVSFRRSTRSQARSRSRSRSGARQEVRPGLGLVPALDKKSGPVSVSFRRSTRSQARSRSDAGHARGAYSDLGPLLTRCLDLITHDVGHVSPSLPCKVVYTAVQQGT
jgi:hypothetical protein